MPLLIVMLFLTPLPNALAGPIDVNNPSFEVLPAGGLPFPGYLGGVFSIDNIPGWSNNGESGQFQPGAVPNGYFDSLSNGPTNAYSNGGFIDQTVGATVQVGVTYTLLVDIGFRKDFACCTFAGSVNLGTGGTTTPATGAATFGAFSTFTATYVGLPADAGGPITIELNSSGAQGNFDNVRLNASAQTTGVPEPAAVFLFATGLAGLLAYSWRQRKKAA